MSLSTSAKMPLAADHFGADPDGAQQTGRRQHTYLLHIWRTTADHPWRFTLRQAGGQETQHFPSLAALVAALWQQLREEEIDHA
ncbi:MAG: hypothetical protein R3C14_20085 [Caldilineaceae bacterium]